MEGNPVYDKALAFAIRVVRLYKYLNEEKQERVMSKQLLRKAQYQSMADDCHELYKMTTSIILSTKQKIQDS